MNRDLRNVDLNLLIVFSALSEHNHLTKAAESLHMSQPAVSNALARLRELFDDELFVRAPKGMRPTQKAKSLIAPIKQALGLIQEQLNPSDRFEISTAKNRFAISVNGFAEYVLFPKFIKAFRQAAPHITLDIYPESNVETIELLKSGEIDIAVDYIQLNSKDFSHEVLFEEDLVVVANKDHPALKNGLTLAHYNSLPHVVVHPRSHKGSPTEIILGRKQIRRNVSITVTNFISLPAIAAESDMLCTLPKGLAKHFEKSLPIQIFEPPFHCPPVPVYLIYSRDKTQDKAHQWLRQQVSAMSRLLKG